jgi:hypothetical protein
MAPWHRGMVIRDAGGMRTATPAYFGTYGEFGEIRAFLDRCMHHYSNQDHSMLAANSADSSMISGNVGKQEIWRISAEHAHREEIGGTT